MATAQLSQSDKQIHTQSLRPLTPLLGSSLVATYAYRKLPTDNQHIQQVPSSTHACIGRYTPQYSPTHPTQPQPPTPKHFRGHHHGTSQTMEPNPKTRAPEGTQPQGMQASIAAVLRDISGGTSYQMIRLVFRRYTHILPSSCTSEWLRASSALSHTFPQHMCSSSSFGSYTHAKSLSAHAMCIVSLVRVPRRARQQSPYTPRIFISHPIHFHISIALLLRYRSSPRI